MSGYEFLKYGSLEMTHLLFVLYATQGEIAI